MATLTKKDIIDEIAIASGLERKEATEALDGFISIVKEELAKGGDVTLSGFGKWQVRQKHARRGRNPQTGEELTIAPRKVVTFALSQVLRSELTRGK